MKSKGDMFFKIAFIIIGILLIVTLLAFIYIYGLGLDFLKFKYDDREVGDFIVRFYDDYCEIYGTTEQGNSKRFLVIPEYIDGVRVDSFGYRNSKNKNEAGSYESLHIPEMSNDVLEKIYFEKPILFFPWRHGGFVGSRFGKLIYPGVEAGFNKTWGLFMYYPKTVYEAAGKMKYYANKNPANVSFYYNYDNGEESDYYWIDDCNYGTKIEFIPKDPVREGYTFGGWYKERECINAWDFDNDTLPEEKKEEKEVIEDGETAIKEMTVYQETILYAKWI